MNIFDQTTCKFFKHIWSKKEQRKFEFSKIATRGRYNDVMFSRTDYEYLVGFPLIIMFYKTYFYFNFYEWMLKLFFNEIVIL